MGDRANVKIYYEHNTDESQDAPVVYLYTHWGGYDLPGTVHEAISRKERWDDTAYLTRIIFCAMCTDTKGSTGYGISPYICDNEHPIIAIRDRTIPLENEKGATIYGPETLEEFAEDPDRLRKAFEELPHR